ncbi:MAG: NBR1-Ig-like domain-containing protein, partial [Chloroflexota bacterium]
GCFVAQVTGQSLSTDVPQPNQLFRVTWNLLNRGTCEWTGDVRLKFVSGDRLGASEFLAVPSTAAGERNEVVASFVAPADAGTYSSEWALVDPDGNLISAVQTIVIEVE